MCPFPMIGKTSLSLVRSEGQVVKKAVYIAIGIGQDSRVKGKSKR